MLVVQLKNTSRPINYGEFQPRLSSRKGGSRSGSAGASVSHRLASSLRPEGHDGPHSPTAHGGSMSSRAAAPGSATPRAREAKPSAKLAKDKEGLRQGSKDVRSGSKVFANRNTYTGTWLDERMHGDGLYTWSDGSEYAGEFNEGYMWGQGEKRWPNGRRYQGEWQRDMMWGDGELTWPSGETFMGQFRKGIFHGKGKRKWPDGDCYMGEFKNGEQEGEGTFESASEGWIYTGRWLHGRMFGEGKVVWPSGIAYDGEWKDGIREGHGRLTWPDGSLYEGQFLRNCIEGKGRKVLTDKSWFEGIFHDGELEGHGTFHWPDGTNFEGLWHNSEIVGPGCHRFPDDTMITGVFEDRGASGEGTKRWASGCLYTGTLLQNRIDQWGCLKWPDGRCYVGNFQDENMHGDGTLIWYDKDGMCKYKGQFERNAFHGLGVLEWSNKARYEGEFRDGLYHGEGKFEWPDKLNVYRGQWELGEMCGRGVLTTSGEMAGTRSGDAFVYVGEFRHGNMEGSGDVTFVLPDGKRDKYTGEFRDSMFNGLGTFSWATGHSISGVFEDNNCNSVGRKVYPEGQVYIGELRNDLEQGKGVLMEADKRLVGLWNEGCCVDELFETFVPALELDSIEGEEWEKVFGGLRKADVPPGGRPELPEKGEDGEQLVGKAILLFLNGDKYVGEVKGGKKHGLGMYVYADLTAYKGHWSEDVMDSVKHPMQEGTQTEQVTTLHKVNVENQQIVEALKLFAAGSNKPPATGSNKPPATT